MKNWNKIKPEIAQLERKHNRNRIPENSQSVSGTSNLPSEAGKMFDNDTADIQRHHNNEADINGTMTLNEISERFNINVDELAKAINVPADNANERLGRLKKRYGFSLDDLRLYVKTKSDGNDR